MFKKSIALLLTAFMVCSLAACGGSSSGETSKPAQGTESQAEKSESTETAESQAEVNESTETAESQTEDSEAGTESTDSASQAEVNESAGTVPSVSSALAEDEEALIAAYADQFEQLTYTDSETGLSITFNLYLPEEYDASSSYPMVVFIADSSCAGSDATVSLTQGRGALVWATEEWQAAYPTIVAVPTYPETILDDHGSYTTTEYVELTKRFIDYMSSEYAVDTNRIYGTGQSMGCMTTLILASEYPNLYAACMFVDGQWDVSTLSGLEDQTFVYFAAEDDTNAWNGAQEVMSMFDTDSVSYAYAQWDGNWSVDELSAAAQDFFTADENQYFISWKTGTIDAGSAGGSGMSGGPGSSGTGSTGSFGGPGGSGAGSTGGFGGPGSSGTGSTGDFGGPGGSGAGSTGGFGGPGSSGTGSTGEPAAMSGGMSGAGSSSYHMASFDYAYNCVAVMEWLFQQTK